MTAKLWTLAQFSGTHPAQDTALPASAAVQSGTTGTAHGGAGAIRFTGVTTGSYVVSFNYNGKIVYQSFDVVAAPFADVTDYGAVGDGSTDDTAAIQSCLNDTAVGIVYFPPGTYSITNVTITRTGLVMEGQGATIAPAGTGSSGTPRGLTFSGSTNRDITIRNLRFLGDGVAANYHAGVKVPTGVSIEGLRIENCHFQDLAVGVFISSSSGTLDDIAITHCRFEDMVGTGTSQGRGVYCFYSVANPLHLTVSDCDFESTSAHGVHIANADLVKIERNAFRNHRSATFTDLPVPCVLVQRGENIRVDNNQFRAYSDGAVGITPNVDTIKRVSVSGNQFDEPQNAVASIQIGAADPAGSGTVENIAVSGNQLYQTAQTVPGLILFSGILVLIEGNQFQIEALAGTTYAFDLVGAGESAGTSVYTDDVRIQGNTCRFTFSGGTGYGIRLRNDTATTPDQLFATSNIRAYFHNNSFPGASANVSVGASITGPELYVTGMRHSGLAFATGQGVIRLDEGTMAALGGRITAYRALTATATLTALDHTIAASAAGGSITVNLPTAVGIDGTEYTIFKTDTSANVVTIDPAGSETIDGQLARAFSLEYEGITVRAVGGNWRVIGSTSKGVHQRRCYRHSAAAAVNLTYEDDFLTLDSSGNNITVNLPPIAGYQGMVFRILRHSASNTVTLDGDGAETILSPVGVSAATYVIPATAGRWVEIIADATEWKAVGGLYV